MSIARGSPIQSRVGSILVDEVMESKMLCGFGRGSFLLGTQGDGHADERNSRSLTSPSLNRDQEEKTVPQVFLPWYRPRPVRSPVHTFCTTPSTTPGALRSRVIPIHSADGCDLLWFHRDGCGVVEKEDPEILMNNQLTEPQTGSLTSPPSSSVMSFTLVPAVASTAV